MIYTFYKFTHAPFNSVTDMLLHMTDMLLHMTDMLLHMTDMLIPMTDMLLHMTDRLLHMTAILIKPIIPCYEQQDMTVPMHKQLRADKYLLILLGLSDPLGGLFIFQNFRNDSVDRVDSERSVFLIFLASFINSCKHSYTVNSNITSYNMFIML